MLIQHEGRVYSPDGRATYTDGSPIKPEDVAVINAEFDRQAVAHWGSKPDRMLAYYSFPAEDSSRPFDNGGRRPWRESFTPRLSAFGGPGNVPPIDVDKVATVSTWTGSKLGTITAARVYGHNFGGRFVALTVRGTNGETYHGRASWDWGSCVWLRRSKARRTA